MSVVRNSFLQDSGGEDNSIDSFSLTHHNINAIDSMEAPQSVASLEDRTQQLPLLHQLQLSSKCTGLIEKYDLFQLSKYSVRSFDFEFKMLDRMSEKLTTPFSI